MGIEELAGKLDDLSRNREALALLILQGQRAVPVLADVLLGPPSSIPEPRRLAAEGLGAIGGEAAVGALIQVLTLHDIRRLDPVLRLAEEAVRNRAAEELGKIGDRRAVEPLLYALAHEGLREAMGALARFKEERAIPHLVRRLEDPCDRAAAADALITFGRAAVPALQETLRGRRPSSDDEAPVSVERRAEAVRLLGVVGDRSVLPCLRARLDDPAEAVRLEAALALVALLVSGAPEQALGIIAQGLGYPNLSVGMRCADALVAEGDRSIPHLLSLGGPRRAPMVGPRTPGDDTIQVMVIEVLERIGTVACARAIADFLHDRSRLVRERIMRALLRLNTPAHAAGAESGSAQGSSAPSGGRPPRAGS
jgi:HEAT repeat protein